MPNLDKLNFIQEVLQTAINGEVRLMRCSDHLDALYQASQYINEFQHGEEKEIANE